MSTERKPPGAPLCATCAVQQPPGPPPQVCPICADERQYVPRTGQRWTSLEDLRAEGHRHTLENLEPGLTGIAISPRVGIGQRPIHVRSGDVGVLWDCSGYLDDQIVAAVERLGGVDAIGISHPHFYGAMVEWAHAFDAQIWIPEADREWVQRPDPSIRYWTDEARVAPGVRLIQCGGHFDGSAVLHWEAVDGAGVVLVGDTATITSDRNFSFMRSYPNLIPLPPAEVWTIAERIMRRPFARAYGGWSGVYIEADAQAALQRSADRYIAWATGASWPSRST